MMPWDDVKFRYGLGIIFHFNVGGYYTVLCEIVKL